ncbi:neurexin-4-like [Dendronephthya gigantea]|uniref:neurexin-4-like n=1 Tax=Dendronephthya gigantea TaxID=151771 RepID=UPI00106B9F54|nr:neurexin-4-like [Dendronephthya gigantea]
MLSNIPCKTLVFLACLVATSSGLPVNDAEVDKLQKKVENMEMTVKNQQNSIQGLESKFQSQERRIQTQESQTQNQSKIIQDQGNAIKELENEYRGILDFIHTSHYATCAVLKRQSSSTSNGMYNLYPTSSRLPARVYCDMTSKGGVGVTVIAHDSQSRTLVKGYEAAGSYRRNITYDISMEQIVAIMKRSKGCEQYIKYECYRSMLLKESDGWWVSRQGLRMNYWGGAPVDSGKCGCSQGRCAGLRGCNCDKNDDEWRQDSGYLTDMRTLPVTELRFGDTGGGPRISWWKDESGYHTLGKLRCWG